MIRITRRGFSERTLLRVGMILCAGAFFVYPIHAETNNPPTRLGLSLAAGAFRANQPAFRDLYGNLNASWNIGVQVRVFGNAAVIAGFRSIRTSGATVIVGPPYGNEHHPLQFGMSSLKMGGRLSFPLRRWAIFVDGGGSYNVSHEKWEDTDLSVEERTFGYFAGAGADVSLTRRLSFFARVEYSLVDTGTGARLEPRVNLGGIEGTLGFSLRF
jgi:hypothetical protein